MSSMSSISLLSPLFRGKSAFLQSPWPICMFYFSNPLSSPSSGVDDCAVFGNNDETRFTGNYNYSTTTEAPATATTPSNGDDENAGHANETDRIRLASFVPWSGGAPLTGQHGKLALALLSRPNYHFLHDWVYVCNWYFSQFPPSRTH